MQFVSTRSWNRYIDIRDGVVGSVIIDVILVPCVVSAKYWGVAIAGIIGLSIVYWWVIACIIVVSIIYWWLVVAAIIDWWLVVAAIIEWWLVVGAIIVHIVRLNDQAIDWARIIDVAKPFLWVSLWAAKCAIRAVLFS